MPEFVWNSRKLFRILFGSKASFRLNKSSKNTVRLKEKTVFGKLLDLSEGGCGLESPSFVPAGVRLNIFLDRNLLVLSGEKKKTRRHSKIVGVVKTSRQLPDRKYRLGIQFEKISPEDLKLIRDFVNSQDRREDKRITFPNP